MYYQNRYLTNSFDGSNNKNAFICVLRLDVNHLKDFKLRMLLLLSHNNLINQLCEAFRIFKLRNLE